MALPKPDGVFRILGLGDSFTYGVGAGYRDTYLRRLERMLNAQAPPGTRVDVVKAGVPRYFTEPERILLETVGVDLDPDLVIVGFVPNDVADTVLGIEAIEIDASGYLVSRESRQLGDLGRWTYLHVDSGRIVLGAWLAWQRSRRSPVHWRDIFVAGGSHEPQWRLIEAELTRMAAVCRNLGVPFVVLHIPMQPPWTPASSYPARRLEEWARHHDALFVDALPRLQWASERGRTVYWTRDGHCTPDGYRVVGDVLADALRQHALIPRRQDDNV